MTTPTETGFPTPRRAPWQIVAVVLLAGCPHPAAVETQVTLAPDAVLALDGRSVPLGNANKGRAFGVVDVARLGSTVAMLLVDQVTGLTGTSHNPNCPLTCPPVTSNTTSSSFQITVSTDLGATWGTPIPVPQWPSPTALSPAPMPSGILLGAGHAYLVHDYVSDSPLASSLPQRTARELNLTTGRFVANAQLDDVLLSIGFGQRGVTAAGFDSFTGGSGAGNFNATLTSDSLALATGALSHKVQRSATPYRIPDIWTSTNGGTWMAAQSEGTQVCVYRATPFSSLTPTRTCWADALFPPEIGSPTASIEVVESTRGPFLLSTNRRGSDGHVMAALVDPTPLALDLGLMDVPLRNPGIHARYGGLLLGSGIGFATGAPILDITATGVDQVSIPASPCTTAPCGSDTVQLAWLLELTSTEALAFYVVETGAFDGGLYGVQTTSHPLLVTRKVTPTRTPFGGAPPSLAAKPAPALMNACTVMSSCFSIPRQACVDVFQQSTLTAPTRNQLLTTYTSGCSALAPLWPDASFPGRTGCTQGCSGNVAVTCSGGKVATATDCSRYSATCGVTAGVLACGDGSAALSCGTCSSKGSAVTCDRPVPTATACAALGRSCQLASTGPLCPIPTPCTNEVSCSGDSLTRCVEGHFRMTDCAEHGQTCTTANGGACVSAAPYQACADKSFVETCDGTRALYCSGGTLLVSDCAVLGFTKCAVVAGEARCAP